MPVAEDTAESEPDDVEEDRSTPDSENDDDESDMDTSGSDDSSGRRNIQTQLIVYRAKCYTDV